ncbi:hypothetical protein NFI96_004143 [Prochilodus magdalenae]|nr:hypothetical protein NFI96_004143 [Prochilodus magdalenae]
MPSGDTWASQPAAQADGVHQPLEAGPAHGWRPAGPDPGTESGQPDPSDHEISGVVPGCHGVTQNGSGSSSVTSPALVLVETPNESVCGGTVVSTKMKGLLLRVTHPEGLVSLHLHPYRTICRNCVEMFKLHGMDYHRTPLGTSTAPYRDVWRVGLTRRPDAILRDRLLRRSGLHSSPEHSFYLLSQEVTQNAKPDAVLECLSSIWELHCPFLSRSETLAELYTSAKKRRSMLLQSRAGSSQTGTSCGWCGSARRWGQMLREDGGMGTSRGSLRRPVLLQLPVHDPSITKEGNSQIQHYLTV